MTEPTTLAGRSLLEDFPCKECDPDGWRDEVTVTIIAIEQEARFKHTDPGMADRCDGRCATDECVCPDGGWHAECDRIEQKAAAAERERIAAGVRKMPVWGLTHAYDEIRTSVLAVVEEHRDD